MGVPFSWNIRLPSDPVYCKSQMTVLFIQARQSVHVSVEFIFNHFVVPCFCHYSRDSYPSFLKEGFTLLRKASSNILESDSLAVI